MKVLHFQVKGMEAKHMAWLMASNPRRPFDLIWTALPNVGSEKCCWPCPIRPARIVLVHDQSGRRSRVAPASLAPCSSNFNESLACHPVGCGDFVQRCLAMWWWLLKLAIAIRPPKGNSCLKPSA
jgi:hypothetical protein